MYRQGALDSLCGVYAIINSSKAMCDSQGVRLDRKGCQALFVELCGELAGGGRLAEALADGTTIRTFQQMTRTAHAWLNREYAIRLKSVRAFGQAPEGLAEYWSRILDHGYEFGAGSVMIRLSGKREHWTCIRSVTARGITLMDSDGIRALRRDRCTVAEPAGRRQHQLCPTQTLLVSA